MTNVFGGTLKLTQPTQGKLYILLLIISERELTFTFAICHRRSVCRLSLCRLSVCLSVTFVHPTQAIDIFGTVSIPFDTVAIC